jgi:hypothetical protein
MNPVFLAWLVQGQPRKRKRDIKVQGYVINNTTTAISESQAQDGADGI